jgi:hypothetical protein
MSDQQIGNIPVFGAEQRLVRLMHDRQWMRDPEDGEPLAARMLAPDWPAGFRFDAYPAVVPLWTNPKGGDGAVPYTLGWIQALRRMNPAVEDFQELVRTAAGLFNSRGGKNSPIPLNPTAANYAEERVAEGIGSAGNAYEVIEERSGSVRVKQIDPRSAPQEMNYWDSPTLVNAFTAVNLDGSLSKTVGRDVFFPNLGTGGWVPAERVEFFPRLPLNVTIRTTLKIRSGPGTEFEQVGTAYLAASYLVEAYALRGSDAWGRIADGWICLQQAFAGGPKYYTSWQMATEPPLPPKRPAGPIVVPEPPAEETQPDPGGQKMLMQGKYVYLYPASYLAPANQNVIWPAGSPERLEWARLVAEKAKAAGVSWVLLKVADGTLPYNKRRRLDDGTIIYNSNVDAAVDDCPELIDALHAVGIKVAGWQFVYSNNVEAQVRMAILRMRELDLDAWIVNAEYAHKSYRQNGKTVTGMQVDWSLPLQELQEPPGSTISIVDAYMAPARAECAEQGIWLGLSSYKYPSYHPSFPWRQFLHYCDAHLPQVYPIGDTRDNAHAIQLAKSLDECRALDPWMPIYPTGGAFSEHGWTATVAQITDFFEACQLQGLAAGGLWEWSQMSERFPAFWEAMAAHPWPIAGEEPVPAEPETPQGEGDPDWVPNLRTISGVRLWMRKLGLDLGGSV